MASVGYPSNRIGSTTCSELHGLTKQRCPLVLIAAGKRNPLTEDAAIGKKGLASALSYEAQDPFSRQLDDEVARAFLHRGEEATVEAQTGEAHHGGTSY